MRSIGYNDQRDNFEVRGIKGSSQCFATSIWMWLSFYFPLYLPNDDVQLKGYIEEVTKRAASDAFEWDIHRAVAQEYLSRRDIKGTVKTFIDYDRKTDDSIGTMSADDFKERLKDGPIVVGTKKMGGLPGGHIILAVDVADDGILVNDPFGNALTKYSDKNGHGIIYPLSLFDARYPEGPVRTLLLEV